MLTLPPLMDFAVWLIGQPPPRVIGQRLHCAECPLAVWLRHALKARAVVVDDERIWISRLEDEWVCAVTPMSYRELIEVLDYAGRDTRDVTVRECVEVLKLVLSYEGKEVPKELMWLDEDV